MSRTSIIAIVLSLATFLGWEYFHFRQKKSLSAAEPTSAQESRPTLSADSVPRGKAESRVLKLADGEVTLGNGPEFFEGWRLDGYTQELDSKSPHVDLKSVTHQNGLVRLQFDRSDLAYLSDVRGTFSGNDSEVVWTYEDQNVILRRKFRPSEDRHYLTMTLESEFKKEVPASLFLTVTSQIPETVSADKVDWQVAYWTNDDIERVNLEKFADELEDETDTGDGRNYRRRRVESPVKWVAAMNRYFIFSLVAEGDYQPHALVLPIASAPGVFLPNTGKVLLWYRDVKKTISVPMKVYFGSMEINALRAVEPTLDHAVDFGFFAFLAYPLLKLLLWFYGYFQNYGTAIVLTTLLVKILLFPLTYKSIKSMRQMSKLQPMIEKLKEKYGNDRERLNREMLSFMKNHGYNPLSGCLPVLAQIPVFLALYRTLYSSVELYQAPFFGWIQDLSAKDPIYVLPVLVSITWWLQQKITPMTTTDPMQKKMMEFMPLVFGGMFIVFPLPSGLMVYFLVNALSSILQQVVLNRKFGGPPGGQQRSYAVAGS